MKGGTTFPLKFLLSVILEGLSYSPVTECIFSFVLMNTGNITSIIFIYRYLWATQEVVDLRGNVSLTLICKNDPLADCGQNLEPSCIVSLFPMTSVPVQINKHWQFLREWCYCF